jgi:alkylation response protein AidB-like acyl-CoA dehydrogenase
VSDDGDDLAVALRRMLSAEAPLSSLRNRIDGHESPGGGVHDAISGMGLMALPIPEAGGGLGAGWKVTVRVFEELGRVLEPGGYLSTIGLALPALLRGGAEEALVRLLPRIAGGELTLAYAATETRADGWSFERMETSASRESGSWRVFGKKTAVLNAQDSDAHLVPALTDDGIGLFLIRGDAGGVKVVEQVSVDLSRPVATVHYEGAEAEAVHRSELTEGDLRAALDVSRLAVAAEAVGVTDACLEMAVRYARERQQFGRAIGSFQAIKHLCADMLLQLEGARSAVYAAAVALDSDAEDAAVYTCLAKLVAGDVVRQASQANIQIHGAMGFTWEHDAHLYYRRAIADALLLGDSSTSRTRLMQNLGVQTS